MTSTEVFQPREVEKSKSMLNIALFVNLEELYTDCLILDIDEKYTFIYVC